MSDVASLLPPSATAQERAIEQATARVGAVPVPLRTLWDPDDCPAALLPWLAWTYSVDRWSSSWTEAQKRASIRAAAAVHRYKGTVASIRDAVGALGYTIDLTEWWELIGGGEGGGLAEPPDPHTFTALVDTGETTIDEEDWRALEQVIEATKPLRSHMIELGVTAALDPATLWAGGAVYDGDYTYLTCEVGELPEV